ncbi:MAG: hypothetical protein KF769_13715 [Parvibaculum sp.]|uniref:DUF6949 family protein n=1 Tax=Parvibaculum sp. TaxID=2024848 RepID=UPI000CC6A09F|nr:hypothetical protein [Parvibaculum sp.]MBX3488351.1 hypothetical protein [Parvibaculum sp.]MBX3497292.1 hypothetical protein [Parvibaculum sp.]MCW5727671.1 hypothetical protein [Parvibaculum sp.]PKQ06805.1 MAG: hypothetical protein CVT72_05380 [Alphaproteobacteria bacterium HGW-Alphaproteobacteria-11]
MSAFGAFFFAIATGFIAAGLTGSFYRLVTNKPPSFQLMSEPMYLQVIGILTLVFAGPTVILRNALRAQVFENRPPVWMLLSSCIAVMWSFLSGVFLLGVMLSAG